MKFAAKDEREAKQGGIIPGRLVQVTRDLVPVRVPAEEAKTETPRLPAARGGEASGEHDHGTEEPQITLIREGDVIQAIEVTCSCGQKIRLRCSY